jgi:hypothetical protein
LKTSHQAFFTAQESRENASMINPSANQLLNTFTAALELEKGGRHDGKFYAGVDLGTAYIVTAVVNSEGVPVAGAITRSLSSIRDGLVLDYMGAIRFVREQVQAIRDAGFAIEVAEAAYPPGTMGANAKAFANVLEAADLHVTGLIDEPSAAALVLGITEGAVVDIGGGTTGISILHHGEVHGRNAPGPGSCRQFPYQCPGSGKNEDGCVTAARPVSRGSAGLSEDGEHRQPSLERSPCGDALHGWGDQLLPRCRAGDGRRDRTCC